MSEELITISGLDETLANLDALPKKVIREALAKGFEAAQIPLLDELRRLAAYSTHEDELRDLVASGELTIYAHLRDAAVASISMFDDGGVLEAGFSGPWGHVANWLEYGHRMVARRVTRADRKRGYVGKLIGSGFVDPHPFMGDALEACAERCIEAFANAVEAYMDSATVAA